MKKIFSISLLALSSSLFVQASKIKIDVDRTIVWIDLKICGVFMKPIISLKEEWTYLPRSTSTRCLETCMILLH